jgi:hypothetical protein
MRKENCKGEEHNQLPRDLLGGHSPRQSSPTQLHCVNTLNTSEHRHRRQMEKASGTPCSNICQNWKIRKQAASLSDNHTLKVATVVPQIMTELREAVSEEDIIIVITNETKCLLEFVGCSKS